LRLLPERRLGERASIALKCPENRAFGLHAKLHRHPRKPKNGPDIPLSFMVGSVAMYDIVHLM
jgi:hypothetical protein